MVMVVVLNVIALRFFCYLWLWRHFAIVTSRLVLSIEIACSRRKIIPAAFSEASRKYASAKEVIGILCSLLLADSPPLCSFDVEKARQ